MTTEDMMMESSFGGWDFVDTWEIDEGNNYPTLRPCEDCSIEDLSEDLPEALWPEKRHCLDDQTILKLEQEDNSLVASWDYEENVYQEDAV